MSYKLPNSKTLKKEIKLFDLYKKLQFSDVFTMLVSQ